VSRFLLRRIKEGARELWQNDLQQNHVEMQGEIPFENHFAVHDFATLYLYLGNFWLDWPRKTLKLDEPLNSLVLNWVRFLITNLMKRAGSIRTALHHRISAF
jgi:hypothetical protein